MTTTHEPPMNLAQTSEGAQELESRDVVAASERLRELGAVLRLSESEALEHELDQAPDDQTMIINMGPQHPSTHGVLRLMLELQGETVLLFGMFLLHGSLDNRSRSAKVRLSADVRFQPAGDPRDDRWFGAPPPAHGGRSYGGLNGAQPLTAKPIAR